MAATLIGRGVLRDKDLPSSAEIRRFHLEVGNDKFMEALARVARTNYALGKGDREAAEIAEKALELVQSWGEAFTPQYATLPIFVDTYHSLRREGLPFDDSYGDGSRAPIFTPPPTAAAAVAALENGGGSEAGSLLHAAIAAASKLKNLVGSCSSVAALDAQVCRHNCHSSHPWD